MLAVAPPHCQPTSQPTIRMSSREQRRGSLAGPPRVPLPHPHVAADPHGFHAATAARRAGLRTGPLTPADVLHLQRTVGNQAVGRLLSKQTVHNPAGRSVIQRLKKGDFKELGSLGLDVGTWIEFAEAVNKLSYHALAMASASLQQRKDIGLDLSRAQLLIERRKRRLKPTRSRILDLYFGEDPVPKPKEKAAVRERQIVVGDGVAETTVIETASDLLIWLVSHPTGSAKSPRSYADVPILTEVLDALWAMERTIEPPEVWDALRNVLKKHEQDEDDDDEVEDADGVGGLDEVGGVDALEEVEADEASWKPGEWDERADEQGIPRQDPARFVRKIPEEAYKAALREIAGRLSGHKLVGLHATRIESTTTLVTEGVSKARFDTGHGVGKGAGFYIVPTTGKVNKSVRDSVESWGRHVVAVYVPKDSQMVKARDGENVQTLEAEHEGGCCYYQFGEAEVVIPPSLCDQVILITDPADISVADPGYKAVRDPRGTLDFLDNLPRG